MTTKKCGIDTWNMQKQCHEDPVHIFCQEPATETVRGLDGTPLRGKVCKYHAKQTEMMIQAVNGLVTSKQSKN